MKIQGSQTNIDDTGGQQHSMDTKHISFDDACKKDDGDEVCKKV